MKVIEVKNISKKYHLGAIAKDSLVESIKGIFKGKKKKKESFMALKDISFEVNKGEVLGVIGKNGAGKSTLLKVLSRITEPTSGEIKIRGRVASLLEVGTGFHPELTGRENVFLNGAILGMQRKEIKAKFEEIVAFAGVEKFIDTPVKHYSSGMYVRLAFSVAAHLEPEILIIDEVLAVGDAEFQKKCLGKMKAVAGEGRTVLFVSHNMAAVKSLCNRCLVLKQGKIAFEGETDESIDSYLKIGRGNGTEYLRYYDENEFTEKGFKIAFIGVKAKNKDYGDPILRTDEIEFNIEFCNYKKSVFRPYLRFKDGQGNFIFVTGPNQKIEISKMNQNLKLIMPSNFFNQGSFFVDFHIADSKSNFFMSSDELNFNIIQEKIKLGEWMGKTVGPLKPNFNWILK